jgi:hypothetical protein
MCNLYSETKGQAAIRGLFRAAHDRTGNIPAFPDEPAPIVRNGRELFWRAGVWRGRRNMARAPVMNMSAPLQTATAALVFQC